MIEALYFITNELKKDPKADAKNLVFKAVEKYSLNTIQESFLLSDFAKYK